MTSQIALQFASASDLGSEAIEWFSHGMWSHVDSLLPDGSLLGARDDEVGGAPAGVQIRPPGYKNFARALRVDLAADDAMTARYYDFVRAQIGKPYDQRGILAFVAGRDWRSPGAWFCSELVAAGLEACGFFAWPLAAPANRITPSDLVLLLSGRQRIGDAA